MKKILTFLLVSTMSLGANAASDGINRLIGVSTLKADQANQDALNGADKQRDLIKKQQGLRNNQDAFSKSATPPQTGNPMLQQQIKMGLMPANQLPPEMMTLNSMLQGLNNSPRDPASLGNSIGKIKPQITKLQGITDKLINGFDYAEKQGVSKGGKQSAEALRKKFDDMMKDLEAKDRMGNFEIQRLMSSYNQAETLASSVQKKADDTQSATIGKI